MPVYFRKLPESRRAIEPPGHQKVARVIHPGGFKSCRIEVSIREGIVENAFSIPEKTAPGGGSIPRKNVSFCLEALKEKSSKKSEATMGGCSRIWRRLWGVVFKIFFFCRRRRRLQRAAKPRGAEGAPIGPAARRKILRIENILKGKNYLDAVLKHSLKSKFHFKNVHFWTDDFCFSRLFWTTGREFFLRLAAGPTDTSRFTTTMC